MRFLAYALALSVLTAPALAQSLPSVPPTTGGETTQQPTEAVLPDPVPLAKSTASPTISSTKPLSIAKVINRNTATLTTPTSTTAALSELEEDPRLQGVNLSLVEIQGSSVPSVATNGERDVTIRWTAVARTDEPTRKQVLSSPFETKLIVGTDTAELPADQELTARGDNDALVEAILAVLSEEEDAPQQQQAQKDGATAQPNAPPQGAGGGSENPLASDFETPAPLDLSDDPAPVVTATTEGCDVRIALEEGVAIVQEQTVRDGIPQGDCADTLTRLTIQESFVGCSDIIAEDHSTATATFRRFFVSTDTTTQFIDADCVPSEDLVFDIVEDTEGCGFRVDPQEELAFQQARLTYNDRTNRRVELTKCIDSEEVAPVATVIDTEACDIRHDFDAGTSFERGIISFDANGVRQTFGQCFDTDVTFAHFEDNTGCDFVTDLNTNQAFPTSRTAFSRNGQTVLIDAACEPDKTQAIGLEATTTGCDGLFADDFPNQQSYPLHRLFFTNEGEANFVTNCIADTDTTLVHQEQINGFENDDTALEAMPKTEVFVIFNGMEFVRRPASVADDAVAVPYSFVRTREVAVSETFQGCDKFTETVKVDTYMRPDNTELDREVGPGETTGPTNGCSTVIQTPKWELSSMSTQNITGNFCVMSNNVSGNWKLAQRSCNYTGTRILSRDDGQEITETSANTNNAPQTNSFCSNTILFPSMPPESRCETLYTGTEQIQWNQAEDW
jgi:hypothetical protein